MKIKYLIGIIVCIFVLWAGSAVVIYYCIDKDFRGITGDMFGAINALFSGLAFSGLIYTIAVQRQELQEQRKSIEMQTDELTLQRQAIEMQTEELKMQREETARSADQLQMQQQLMDYQIILATVNDLLKLKNEAIDNINTSNRTANYKDRFGNWARSIERSSHLYGDNRKRLEQYEKTCFFILQFIIDSKLNENQIDNLKKITRVNMSVDEIKILQAIVEQDRNQHRLALLAAFDLYI